MKRKLLSLAMIAALCLTMLPSAGWAADGTGGTIDDWQVPEAPETDGSWTDENNYDISWYTSAAAGTTSFTLSDADDLAGLAAIVNGDAKSNGQTIEDETFSGKTITLSSGGNFDLSEKEWEPIAKKSKNPFKGTLDGSDATITGLTITKNNWGESTGLFRYIDSGGTVKNVTLEEVYITSETEMSPNTALGVISAYNSGTVEGCSVSGTVNTTGTEANVYVGGIAGENNSGASIKNCTFNGTLISSAPYIGGIAGDNSGTIFESKNEGKVKQTNTKKSSLYIGGIAGTTSGTVESCTNSGTIATEHGAILGGIAARLTAGTITSCENNTEINSTEDGSSDFVGGIVGSVFVSNTTATISSCKNCAAVTTAKAAVGGILGGIESFSDAKATVKIEKSHNDGAVSGNYIFAKAGGIVGYHQGAAKLEIETSYNTGTIASTNYSSGAYPGIGGILGVTVGLGDTQISDCYNVGAITAQGENNLTPAGGLLGSARGDKTISLSDCYNAGVISGKTTGGIVAKAANSDTVTMADCSYWDGCGAAGAGDSKTSNEMTDNNAWAKNLGLSTEKWDKSTNNEQAGFLPVLKENKQEPAPELTRTGKQDQEALTIHSPLTNDEIFVNGGSFGLTADGGSTNGTITWAVTSGDGIASVDENGKVTLKEDAVGTVTVTATMAGNDDYNDVVASYTFRVISEAIDSVTLYGIDAPIAGATPDSSLEIPADAHYEVRFSAGPYGQFVWRENGTNLDMNDKFKAGTAYTAVISLQPDDQYGFVDPEKLKVEIPGVNPAAITKITVEKDGNMGAVLIGVTFAATTTHSHEWATEWSGNALDHWHACKNDGCPMIGKDYARHVDAGADGICDTCNLAVGYTITFDANGGACTTASVRTNLDGKISTLPDASREGYTFRGWFTAASGGEQVTTETVYSADTTLYAQWEKIPEPPYDGKYSYEIFTDDSAGGALDVDRYATEGEKVTITVLSDDGYALDEIVITDKHGEAIDFVDNGDGTITFTMPSGDVTITATFAEADEPECALPFVDVHANDWFFDPVCYVYREGLMTGTSATTFAPNTTTTRAMIVSILARQENVTSAEDAGFTDVAAGDWYATAVNWAAREGIIAGFEDESFRPNAAITREQLAAILCNYSAWKGEDTSARADLSRYSDAAEISGWATDVMRWAVAEGLISGMTADELQPQGSATRAQVAAILQRYLEG